MAACSRPAWQDGQAGPHGALGVVFARLVHAEGRLDAVAGELQHAALVGLDDVGHAPHRSAEHGQRVLGVHGLRQGGGADDVGKQHRHLAALQAGGLQQPGQPGAQRRGGQLDDRVAERRALAFQRRDCCAECVDVLVLHAVLARLAPPERPSAAARLHVRACRVGVKILPTSARICG